MSAQRRFESTFRFALSGILGGVIACSSSSNGGQTLPVNDASTSDTTVIPLADAGQSDTATPNVDAASADAGTDTGLVVAEASTDATPEAEAGAVAFCGSQVGLAFCADFDEPGALGGDAGASTWDQIGGSVTELSLSTTEAVSTPNSLAIALDGTTGDRSAQVIRTVTPVHGVTQAIYEFDVFMATLPSNPGAGGFITDFQFSDTPAGGGGGSDQFGFRIAVFSTDTGAFDHAELQHNAPALGSIPDDIINISAVDAGAAFTTGIWNHVKIAVAYAAGATADAGASVEMRAYINGDTTPVVDKTYPSPFAAAPFARISDGMVYAFSTSKTYDIFYDNITLKLQ
jgi:hypothetical protein